MSSISERRWELLERWSPTLFLVAGVLIVVFAGMLGYEAVTSQTAPEDIFGPAGFAVAFVGVLGFVPALALHNKRVARAGAILALIAAAGAIVTSVGSAAVAVGLEPPGALQAVSLGIFIGFLVVYPLFAISGLWTGVFSRSFGVLLLVPSVTFAIMLASLPLGLAGPWSAFALSSTQAIAHLAIGFILYTGATPFTSVHPTPDTPTR